MYEIGDDIFTSSELQCTNVLIDYFFKEMLRRSFFDGEFPEFFINHVNDEMTTIARIKNEEGMIAYYQALISLIYNNGNRYGF